MMLHIVNAGPLLSVQDLGRSGYRKFGVSKSGPMDRPALALANALCGNAADVAGLEFAGLGGHFKADRAIHFSVTGADCAISIGDISLPAGETHKLDAGETLKIGALKNGGWGYLAIDGGVLTPPVLGARSTHLRFGLGGFCGRALRANDRLPISDSLTTQPLLRPAGKLISANLPHDMGPIRIILGPQDDYFDPAVIDQLTHDPFTITPQRDRMATVLDGPSLTAIRGHDIVSDGTVPGSIQVPSSGRPIVLMAECQTSGGYPKIATVISADLPRFAQLPTGSAFQFEIVDRRTAEDALRQQHQGHRAILASLANKAETTLSSTYLLSCDLVGGVFDPAALTGQDLTKDVSQ
jgi:allophanate hydrolase